METSNLKIAIKKKQRELSLLKKTLVKNEEYYEKKQKLEDELNELKELPYKKNF